MTDTNHTPGPWHNDQDYRVNAGDRNGPTICELKHVAYYEAVEGMRHQSANARLIAAAPSLLAACEDLLDAFWDMSPLEYAASRGLGSMTDNEGERIKQRGRDAIAKAKGGVMAEDATACRECKHYVSSRRDGILVKCGDFCAAIPFDEKNWNPYEGQWNLRRLTVTPCGKLNTGLEPCPHFIARPGGPLPPKIRGA